MTIVLRLEHPAIMLDWKGRSGITKVMLEKGGFWPEKAEDQWVNWELSKKVYACTPNF